MALLQFSLPRHRYSQWISIPSRQTPVISYDWPAAAIIAAVLYFVTPSEIPLTVARDVFYVGVSVLSLVFSIFFASLAVLITAGDNAVVNFLEETGAYQKIAWVFRSTLFILFVALIMSIALYVATLLFDSPDQRLIVPQSILIVFAFVSSWALFAAAVSTFDAVRYAELRARFIKATTPRKKNPSDEE